MTAPTARQLAIHTWMLAYQQEHAMPPTLAEIASTFSFKSIYSVWCHLRALEKKGLVTHRPMVARGWVARPPATETAA